MPIKSNAIFSALTILALVVSSSPADRILLTNGQTIEGIITKENNDQVILDLGIGSATINRSKIKSITHASENQNETLLSNWQKEHFLNRKNIPPGLEDLADGFKTISANRDSLIKSLQANAVSNNEEPRLAEEYSALQKKMVEVSDKLRAAGANDVLSYNQLVIEHNTANAKLSLKHNEIDNLRKSGTSLNEQTTAYLDSLEKFKTAFNARQADYRKESPDESKTYFFTRISEKLNGFGQECPEYSIQAAMSGRNSIVPATVNGKTQGRFLVDTGASLITLTQSFARRANLDTNGPATCEIFLADGSSRKVPAVSLDSFQVGDAKVLKLEAVIVPSESKNGVDGLVGMNFFQNFQIKLDGASGKLTLRQFNPK